MPNFKAASSWIKETDFLKNSQRHILNNIVGLFFSESVFSVDKGPEIWEKLFIQLTVSSVVTGL